MKACKVRLAIVIAVAAAIPVFGQLITGSLSGTVIDSTGAAIVDARVVVTNEQTGDARTAASGESGDFGITALPPSTYRLRIEKQGFKTFERTGIVLSATQRLAVGNIAMDIGGTQETVTVSGEVGQVQSASSENSAQLSGTQVNLLVTRGRDVISLLRVLPGVSVKADNESLGGTYGTSTPNISGTRNRMNTVSIDGQVGSDADIVDTFNGSTSMDAIAEVQVLLNDYQAEYGRNAGATINLISKSGSRDFHGDAYWFVRNEDFNANDFFNNRNGQQRPLYRYNTLGATIGGPVFIPKLFNRNRDKLFLFYSREDWRVATPQTPWRVMVPTALERAGNFSNSFDVNGKLITVNDPLTQKPFPGNIVPVNRLDPDGQAILNLFPQPNITNRALSGGNYNYQFQEITTQPKKQNLLKGDYYLTPKDHFWSRYQTWWADRRGYQGLAAFNSNWNELYYHYLFTVNQVQTNYTRIITPTIVNEMEVGYRVLHEDGSPTSPNAFDPVIRSKVGITLGQLYPGNNPLDIIPQASFNGVPNAANISYVARTPIAARVDRWSYDDSLSVLRGSHSLKFGIYGELNQNSEGPRGNFGGSIAFDRNPSNPLDTNYAYSNAILGVFSSYSEGSSRTTGITNQQLVEWFAQDSWKATRRLTLEYGLRFTWFTPWYAIDGQAAALSLRLYDPSQAPALIRPALNNGVRVGQNPITGELVAASLIGSYAPQSGDTANGMVVATDKTYPRGFQDPFPLQVAPRFGFAYDVFGNGRTAIRGGFGVTKQGVASAGTMVGGTRVNPPIQYNPQILNGTLSTLLTSTGVLFPGNVTAIEKDPAAPTVYNYSLGVQHNLGFKTILDVKYVGNQSRHLIQNRNLNTLPYGTRFLPQNIDVTTANRSPLPDSFLRTYPGYGNITYVENSGYANYNALQVTANRRFATSLQFGVSYTYSKAMDLTSSDGGGLPIFRPYRVWSYGKSSYDQTHVLVINSIVDLPQGSRIWRNRFTEQAFDGWQLSTIATFASGFPLGINYTTTDNADITGGGDGARVNVTGKAELPYGERSFDRFFNTAVFARPGKGDPGNAPKDVMRGPGFNNWDAALYKKFPFGSEQRYLQLRWEVYNVFNHTQFSTLDTNARFDPSGAQVNPTFGTVTGTNTPRVMQMSLKIVF
jgi:hypothetical protein